MAHAERSVQENENVSSYEFLIVNLHWDYNYRDNKMDNDIPFSRILHLDHGKTRSFGILSLSIQFTQLNSIHKDKEL